MLVPHQNGFHAVLVRQLQQQLHGFIQLAFQPPPGGKHREKSMLLQLLPQGGGKIGHFGKGADPFLVDPPVNLSGAEFRLPQCAGDPFGELRQRQGRDIDFFHTLSAPFVEFWRDQ